MSKLNQMEIFYYVATWNSFSKAAKEMNVSKGYVSTQITALEKDLGTKLLHRTTRHLSLTEEGRLFYDSCVKIVREKEIATDMMKESQVEPSGHLKVSAPPSMCASFLADLLPQFLKKYPKINLTIDSSSTVKNLLQHGIDIALRITHLPDENYIARLVTNFQFLICATPGYLKQHGFPKDPDELLQHNCLIYSADPTQNRWPFEMHNTTKIVSVNGNLISTNVSIIRKALLAHHGIARLPKYIIANDLSSNKLKNLFAENTQMKIPVYAIYSSNIKIPPKIKFFIAFLKDYFGKTNITL